MQRVLTAAVLIPIVLALLFFAPHWLFALTLGVVALVATSEFLKIGSAYGIRPFFKTTFIFIAIYFTGLALMDVHLGTRWDSASIAFSFVIRGAPLLLLVLGMAEPDLKDSLPGAAVSYLAIPYIALTLGALVHVHHVTRWIILLLYLLLIVWIGDIFAYYVGRALGRHMLAPRISPKKTWEGAGASFVAATAIAILLFAYVQPISDLLVRIHLLRSESVLYASAGLHAPPLWKAGLFGALINVAAQLGDLVESMMKRGAAVKDSGTLLPGHGGMLDRIDALLFAAPVLWCYATFHLIPF